MKKTKIEWCDSTLNPVVGCSYGCSFCYARRMNQRFNWIKDFNSPEFFPDRLAKLDSKKSQNIFMDSMSDIADWTPKWIINTFEAIKKNPQHNYLFLSKRPSIYELLDPLFMDNVWFGATGTDTKTTATALFHLRTLEKCNTFLSLEPLLSEVRFGKDLKTIDWVIIGAETGNRKGRINPELQWIEYIVDECDKYGIPIYMKESVRSIVGENKMRRDFPLGLQKHTVTS